MQRAPALMVPGRLRRHAGHKQAGHLQYAAASELPCMVLMVKEHQLTHISRIPTAPSFVHDSLPILPGQESICRPEGSRCMQSCKHSRGSTSRHSQMRKRQRSRLSITPRVLGKESRESPRHFRLKLSQAGSADKVHQHCCWVTMETCVASHSHFQLSSLMGPGSSHRTMPPERRSGGDSTGGCSSFPPRPPSPCPRP
jgi:hypothetical protein